MDMKGDVMKITTVKWVTSLTLIVSLFAPMAHSEEQQSIDCTVEGYDGKLFTALYAKTKSTAASFCKELIRTRIDRNSVDDARVGSILEAFAEESEEALDHYQLRRPADYGAQFTQLKRDLGDFSFRDMQLPEFVVRPSLSGDTEGYFEALSVPVDRFKINEVEHCATLSPGFTCRAVFEDFQAAFNPYRSAYNNIHDNTKQLEAMSRRWDDFLVVSKSQTTLEVWLTTWAQRDHFQQDHLVGPPKYQVIALHPHLIYDIAESAPEGSSQELGLAVEWLGVNFWDLKVPLGLSLASTYVDRPEVEDLGHGLMLHINNHYALGWARYDDVNSFYVTIDLLKMFEDRKKQYDKYLGYFD
jgi:hypothetical protein